MDVVSKTDKRGKLFQWEMPPKGRSRDCISSQWKFLFDKFPVDEANSPLLYMQNFRNLEVNKTIQQWK